MRPVERGASPRQVDFHNYSDALPELVSRLGPYCSYCERYIATNLAVEHIQPKDSNLYPHLIGRWDNFLLGCVNCNSTKGRKDVVLANVMLPDRDNSIAILKYAKNGTISVEVDGITSEQALAARSLLNLTGIDRIAADVLDANDRLVALERSSQRREAWAVAEEARTTLSQHPMEEIRGLIVKLALATGFFSIWMSVFVSDQEMRTRLIHAFPGTSRDCFDSSTTTVVSPRPTNGLEGAGKI